MSEAPRTIAFQLKDPTRNRWRVYTIRVEPTLYQRHALTILRGRLDANLVRRIEEFVTPEQLATRWRELVRRRRAHGYTEVSS